MKRLFIATPMHNRTEHEVFARREEALRVLETEYGLPRTMFEVIDNYHHPDLSKDATRLEHLGESIKQMAQADLVYFDEGWETAKGCQIERQICNIYKINHLISNRPVSYGT